MTDDEYLSTELEAKDATGPAAAHVIGSVAETLEQAPEGRRFDFELTVTERS